MKKMKVLSALALVWSAMFVFSCNNNANTDEVAPEITIASPATTITPEQGKKAAERLNKGFEYLLPKSSSAQANSQIIQNHLTKDDKSPENFTIHIPISEDLAIKVKLDGKEKAEIIYDDKNPTYNYKALLTYEDGECKDSKLKNKDGNSWGSDCGSYFDNLVKAYSGLIAKCCEFAANYEPNDENSYEFYFVGIATNSDYSIVKAQSFPKTDEGKGEAGEKVSEFNKDYSYDDGFSVADLLVKAEFVESYLKKLTVTDRVPPSHDTNIVTGYFIDYGSTVIDTEPYTQQ